MTLSEKLKVRSNSVNVIMLILAKTAIVQKSKKHAEISCSHSELSFFFLDTAYFLF